MSMPSFRDPGLFRSCVFCPPMTSFREITQSALAANLAFIVDTLFPRPPFNL